MVEVGDEIELSAKKVGQAPRTGTVISVRESLLTVRWPTGEQSTLVPSPGTLAVVRPAKSKTTKAERGSGGTSKKKSSGKKRSR